MMKHENPPPPSSSSPPPSPPPPFPNSFARAQGADSAMLSPEVAVGGSWLLHEMGVEPDTDQEYDASGEGLDLEYVQAKRARRRARTNHLRQKRVTLESGGGTPRAERVRRRCSSAAEAGCVAQGLDGA
jgi:hypothetical protein